ncbi:hypothetical protein PAPHI01_1842 [Pancytospora philotis]|nr:hypothetical protein PAPHI01_1842 [Pancytospora philotis]
MNELPKPSIAANPLKVQNPAAGNTTAYGYYSEWRAQLLRKYHDIFRDHYVNKAYHKDSLKKREQGDIVEPSFDLISEEMRQFFASSELLRKSYKYNKALITVYHRKCNKFNTFMMGMRKNIKEFLDFGKTLLAKNFDKLDPATVEELNLLRMKLDRAGLGYTNLKFFDGHIDDDVLGPAESPKVIDDAYINIFKEYCANAFAHISRIPDIVSRQMIVSSGFGFRNCEYMEEKLSSATVGGAADTSDKDPFVYLHLICPELDYKAWGSFWRAVCNQLTNEAKALQKHVDEISADLPNYREILPKCFEEIDVAIDDAIIALVNNTEFQPDPIKITRRLINMIIDNEIEVVARKMLDQVHGEMYTPPE